MLPACLFVFACARACLYSIVSIFNVQCNNDCRLHLLLFVLSRRGDVMPPSWLSFVRSFTSLRLFSLQFSLHFSTQFSVLRDKWSIHLLRLMLLTFVSLLPPFFLISLKFSIQFSARSICSHFFAFQFFTHFSALHVLFINFASGTRCHGEKKNCFCAASRRQCEKKSS